MALMTWDESYSVRVAELDGHHRKLFSLINTLHSAMREGKGTSVIRAIVEELANYTHTHFQREEALMEQAKFVGLASHCKLHRDLIARVSDFKAALDSGKAVNTIEVLEFLREWLAKHIKGVDKGYSSHLNASGIH